MEAFPEVSGLGGDGHPGEADRSGVTTQEAERSAQCPCVKDAEGSLPIPGPDEG